MPNFRNPQIKLDSYDRGIQVAPLQRDGRLTNEQLAEEIGLSPSPCLRRVRNLEEAGVIRGYHAIKPTFMVIGMASPDHSRGNFP